MTAPNPRRPAVTGEGNPSAAGSSVADRCAMPTGAPGGCPLPGDHDGACQPEPRRCFCGRPVSPSANCGCCCREHDLDSAIPARLDERYDPSPEPIDRSIQ